MSKAPKKQLRGRGPKLGGKLRSGKPANERESKAGREKDGEDLSESRKAKSLVQFFRESPLVGLELDLERDR